MCLQWQRSASLTRDSRCKASDSERLRGSVSDWPEASWRGTRLDRGRVNQGQISSPFSRVGCARSKPTPNTSSCPNRRHRRSRGLGHGEKSALARLIEIGVFYLLKKEEKTREALGEREREGEKSKTNTERNPSLAQSWT